MDQVEIRAAASLELRTEGDKRKLVGLAAPYNKRSTPIYGEFVEQIAPGAFDKSLKENDVRALYQHDATRVLGRLGSGTLALRSTDEGLTFELDMPNTSYANDLCESIKRGDVVGMSFGFRARSDSWEKGDPYPVRTLLDIDLREVSVVTDGAYPQTKVALRGLDDIRREAAAESLHAMHMRLRLS